MQGEARRATNKTLSCYDIPRKRLQNPSSLVVRVARAEIRRQPTQQYEASSSSLALPRPALQHSRSILPLILALALSGLLLLLPLPVKRLTDHSINQPRVRPYYYNRSGA